MNRLSFLILVGLSSFTFNGHAAQVKVQILGSLNLSLQDQAKNACYQAAEQMKTAGLTPAPFVVKRQAISLFPGDLIYSVYKAANGSQCAVLDEEATQSRTWNQGLTQIAACVCDLIIPLP